MSALSKDYQKFLAQKAKTKVNSGFEIDESELNPMLFPFQKFCVARALRHGKYALLEDCGLGKTFQQIEFAYQCSLHTGKPSLILAPLPVVEQTILEGEKFGRLVTELQVKSVIGGKGDGYGWVLESHNQTELTPIKMPLIHICNYEQLDNIDTSIYGCIVLDESSILKNYEGETKKLILEKFALTPYKLSCTATPSPNDPMELGNQAEFLDVMTRNEVMAMFFVHDGGETAKWRLKGHAKKPFYRFISSFAIMMSKPQDIGFEMAGYDLPRLNFIEKCIETEKKENGRLFNDTAISATTFNQELRLTKVQRLSDVVEIVNNSTENFIIWIKQNEEGEYLKKLIPDAIEVKGSDSNEFKKKHLIGFAKNEFRVLITKSKIAAFGLNYQNCRNQIFASLDFSFESLYQSIRRSYRFGQKEAVNIYVITTDTMTNVIESINRKQKQFEEMQSEMTAEICSNLDESLVSVNYDTDSVYNEFYTAKRGDCVQLIRELEDESIGLSVFSPPFAELYTYSNHLEDMGNCRNYTEFLEQFSYLVKELYRVLKSGRNVAVHCMDLPIQKGKEGFIGLRDFSGELRNAFEKEGFIYHSRITIWKDPVIEMQRTKALGLLHKQVKKDSTMSRVGLPDYVLVFRKDGERNDKVNCDINVDTWQEYASPIWDFKDLSKEFEMIMPLLSESAYNEMPAELRNKYAKPIWNDINYSNTLQYTTARGENDEKHICPLQLDTIERIIHLYSNKGDTVLTPFGGIGSEIYQALKMDRKAVAFELKESYFQKLKQNASNAIIAKAQTSLF